MRRIANLVWRVIVGLGLAFVVVPAGLGLLLGWLADGLEAEHQARRDPGRQVLTDVGLKDLEEYAPWYYLQAGEAITAFTLDQYDNWTDKNDLRAMVMDRAAQRDGWRVEAVSPEAYEEQLHAYFPEAAFLIAGDVSFDAWYQKKDARAFFDQDTGLMVHWRTGAKPRSRKIKPAGLTVSADGFLYEMETHGGFLGDGTTWQALIVPPEQRAGVEASIAAHADWQEGTVTGEEYTRLHTQVFHDLPALLPAGDVAFERWYYVDTYARMYPDKPSRGSTHADFPAVMQQAGARWSGNWQMAFYDPDTGLLIYYEYDS
jgi:hypothetical protein